jgi:hypothetical protein
MMDAIERAVPGPQAEVIMHGASGGQVFGKTAPLAASAENVHHAVDHLAQINAALAAATLARRNQRLDMRPFLIGQVARIAQRVTVVAGAVFGGPHRAPHKKNRHPERITSEPHSSRGHRAQPIRSTHKVSGRTLRSDLLAKGRHQTDPDNYRGLGFRSDSKERGRFAQLFWLQAEKGNGLTSKMVDSAIKGYEAKRANIEYQRSKEKM